MKPRTAKETAMICVATVLVVTVLIIPFEIVPYGQSANTRGLLWLAVAAVAALAMVLGYRYLTTRTRGVAGHRRVVVQDLGGAGEYGGRRG